MRIGTPQRSSHMGTYQSLRECQGSMEMATLVWGCWNESQQVCELAALHPLTQRFPFSPGESPPPLCQDPDEQGTQILPPKKLIRIDPRRHMALQLTFDLKPRSCRSFLPQAPEPKVPENSAGPGSQEACFGVCQWHQVRLPPSKSRGNQASHDGVLSGIQLVVERWLTYFHVGCGQSCHESDGGWVCGFGVCVQRRAERN